MSKLIRTCVVFLCVTGMVTTASSQEAKPIDLNALAVRGAEIASEDPEIADLRSKQPEGPPRRGFDIGLAAAEGQTLPGLGKQRIHDSLSPDEQGGYTNAVSFTLARNRKKMH